MRWRSVEKSWQSKPERTADRRGIQGAAFGRAPPFNRGGDYSIAFAGAGIRGGQIIGSTARDGGFIQDQPHSPMNYAATVHDLLGIDRSRPVHTREARPVHLADGGQPIRGLV
jgi:hypothetical protein